MLHIIGLDTRLKKLIKKNKFKSNAILLAAFLGRVDFFVVKKMPCFHNKLHWELMSYYSSEIGEKT